MVASTSTPVDLSETGAVVSAFPSACGNYWEIKFFRYLQDGGTETLLMFSEPLNRGPVSIPASRQVSR